MTFQSSGSGSSSAGAPRSYSTSASTGLYSPVAKAVNPVRENGLPGVDLIKLDFELHEPEAVRGMDGLVHLSRPSMIIEVLTDAVAAKLEELLKDAGYLRFYLSNASGSVVPVTELRAHHHVDTNFLLCTEPVARSLSLI